MWRDARRAAIYQRLQYEAASRPGSKRVRTPNGEVWMSPIEAQLYEAMRAEGLSPIPQYCISGYFVDFAFPDVGVAADADGAADHEGAPPAKERHGDGGLLPTPGTAERVHWTTRLPTAPDRRP